MKNNKGITLIALIITIIIMLILVAVSVNVLIKSNLIGTTERAVDKYKTASEEESKGGSITINGKRYDSIEDYIDGDAPKLKYFKVESKLCVYLKDSYFDYIASKKLDEKEQLYAESKGKANIEELIKDNYNNSREEFEDYIQDSSIAPYEMCLNDILVEEKVISNEEYPIYYIENVLKLKTDEEKEKGFIELVKENGEAITLEQLREVIKNQVDNGNYSSATEWLNEFIWNMCYDVLSQSLIVSVTLPSEEKIAMPYFIGPNQQDTTSEYSNIFDIKNVNNSCISENNTIKFKAENYKGKTSELIIAIDVKEFKIKFSDTDIRTYKFIEGQTWNDYIGEQDSSISLEDGMTLSYNSYDFKVLLHTKDMKDELSYSLLNNSEDQTSYVKYTDAIIPNHEYGLVEESIVI